MRRFGIVGPPAVVFLSARDGREIPETRLIGEADAATFTRSLDRSGSAPDPLNTFGTMQ